MHKGFKATTRDVLCMIMGQSIVTNNYHIRTHAFISNCGQLKLLTKISLPLDPLCMATSAAMAFAYEIISPAGRTLHNYDQGYVRITYHWNFKLSCLMSLSTTFPEL